MQADLKPANVDDDEEEAEDDGRSNNVDVDDDDDNVADDWQPKAKSLRQLRAALGDVPRDNVSIDSVVAERLTTVELSMLVRALGRFDVASTTTANATATSLASDSSLLTRKQLKHQKSMQQQKANGRRAQRNARANVVDDDDE